MTTAALPDQPPFAHFLGIKLISVAPDRVEAELAVRDEFTQPRRLMHGGALMAYADSLGGTTSRANLKPGQRTTTIESKTEFLRRRPDRRCGAGRMRAAASRPHHDRGADPHHPQRRQASPRS